MARGRAYQCSVCGSERHTAPRCPVGRDHEPPHHIDAIAGAAVAVTMPDGRIVYGECMRVLPTAVVVHPWGAPCASLFAHDDVANVAVIVLEREDVVRIRERQRRGEPTYDPRRTRIRVARKGPRA